MLILHAGMPKTGTTNLQARLAVHADALRKDGIIYPERWRDEENIAHHGLYGPLLAGGEDREALLAGLAAFLADHPRATTILSNEGMANLISKDPSIVLGLLDRAREAGPIRLVLALRPIDEFIDSTFLHQLKHRDDVESDADTYFAGFERLIESLFSGIALVRDALGEDETRLLPFAKDEAFDRALLGALGIDTPLAPHKRGDLFSNRRLSLKGQTVLAHLKYFNAALDRTIERKTLTEALYAGAVHFEDDIAISRVMPPATADHYHRFSLETAERCGLHEYSQAFGHRQIAPYEHQTLDIERIGPRDIIALKQWAIANDSPSRG